MPDFSKNLGGWGAGASATNATVWVTVIEEYATGNVRRFPFFLIDGVIDLRRVFWDSGWGLPPPRFSITERHPKPQYDHGLSAIGLLRD